VKHSAAGGIGTYSDPITFASYTGEFPKGTIIYVERLKKYFVHEDECSKSKTDWNKSKKYHVDLWVGYSNSQAITQCAYKLPQTNSVEVNPPRNYAVNTAPLFNTRTNTCIV
jgi:hypothetical protein